MGFPKAAASSHCSPRQATLSLSEGPQRQRRQELRIQLQGHGARRHGLRQEALAAPVEEAVAQEAAGHRVRPTSAAMLE